MDLCHRSSSDCDRKWREAASWSRTQAGGGAQARRAGEGCWLELQLDCFAFPPLMRDRNEHPGP